ncbi:hypothetical protein ACAF76_018685 [Brevibacillus sp. TJ4]|uniref:hypothetical protein n=1 Tax=Brevibacillus sp. TJ4 TaxID=3234853 RepID=UPI003BA324E4
MNETIAFDKNKIDSIHTRSNRREVSITDPSTIDIILDDLAKLELRQRKYESDMNKSTRSVTGGKYYIELEDRGELVELIYLSGNLVTFYGYSTGETTVYEIANDPVLEFPGIFHSLQE